MTKERIGYRLLCRYRPGGAEARLPLRIVHLEYMIAALPITVFGGAVLSDQGEPLGMEVLLEVPTRALAERFIADEPYSAAGLFESVTIDRIRVMTPPQDGGPLRQALADERAQLARRTDVR